MALNAGIKGILKQGDHVVVSSMEHNSVIRPLETLKNQGLITYSLVSADKNGSILAKDFTEAMKPGTKLVICTHASNVCGNIYDINELSNIAKRFGAYFMVDAAQSIGTLAIDVKNIDLMAFPGHKSLYGPQGTGAKKGI